MPAAYLLAFYVPCAALGALGVALVLGKSKTFAALKWVLRSKLANLIFFGAALAWFLYHVYNLSQADFGQYKVLLFSFFALVGLAAFNACADFLAVRGLCGLYLMAAKVVLSSLYLMYSPAVLSLKIVLYVGIALAIYLSAFPYRLRDAVYALYPAEGRKRLKRARIAGGICIVLAAIPLILSAVLPGTFAIF